MTYTFVNKNVSLPITIVYQLLGVWKRIEEVNSLLSLLLQTLSLLKPKEYSKVCILSFSLWFHKFNKMQLQELY